MSDSYTYSNTVTFTATHAKYLASKVATDLKRIQRFYGSPTDTQIAEYEKEMTELLKGGFLDRVTYGFRKEGKFIEPSLQYTARELNGSSSSDDDPGRIRPNANISGASFGSFLIYSSKWTNLSREEKESVNKNLPFIRPDGAEPGISGTLTKDKSYSSAGRVLDRSSVIGN